MNHSTSIESVLDLWENRFSGFEYPEITFLNAWRTFSEEELNYAFDVAMTALEDGRIYERTSPSVARYLSSVLKGQRQQHRDVQRAIERRKALLNAEGVSA